VRRHRGAAALPKRWAIAVAAGALAAGAAFGDALVSGLVGSPERPVDAIAVSGARHLAPSAVAGAAAVARGSASGDLDPERVARALTEHPWIASARTLFLPGGTLLVGVVEREPVATVTIAKAVYAVDREGRPFAALDAPPDPALPEIVARHEVRPGEADPRLAESWAWRRPRRSRWRRTTTPRATHCASPARTRAWCSGAQSWMRASRPSRGCSRTARTRRPGRRRSMSASQTSWCCGARRPRTSRRKRRRTADAVRRVAGDRPGDPAAARSKGGNMARKDDLIVGLDIGTTKICVIVAEQTENGIDIVGIGTHPSRGLRKGVVVDIDATVNSIKHAVEEAELMADCEITSVYAGIAGSHIRAFNSHGVVAVKDREVSPSDVKRVIDGAKAVSIPMDREVIHVIPQEFIIDDQDGIREPLGMSGVRLEAKIHIVTAAVTSAQNIVKCANKAGLNVIDIVLEPLASAEASLAEDEQDLGVCLIDIGGGTTDVAVFGEGSIQHTSVLGLGGAHISNDIAVGLRTPFEEAERIKKRFGVASARYLASDDVISVPSVGGRRPREVSRKILCEIIEPRVDEILSLARQSLVKEGLEDRIPSGVVLTGGCSALEGLLDLAEEIFETPVRNGIPTHIGGLQDVVRGPMYATGVGLVLFGASQDHQNTRFRIRDESIFGRVRQRMRDWFYQFE
jgi:cell division protein FtsA